MMIFPETLNFCMVVESCCLGTVKATVKGTLYLNGKRENHWHLLKQNGYKHLVLLMLCLFLYLKKELKK
jgi:hypothetical protein